MRNASTLVDALIGGAVAIRVNSYELPNNDYAGSIALSSQ